MLPVCFSGPGHAVSGATANGYVRDDGQQHPRHGCQRKWLHVAILYAGCDHAEVDVERDCKLPTRPDLQDDYSYVDQLVLLIFDTRKSDAHRSEATQPAPATQSLWITPYYLSQLSIYA